MCAEEDWARVERTRSRKAPWEKVGLKVKVSGKGKWHTSLLQRKQGQSLEVGQAPL